MNQVIEKLLGVQDLDEKILDLRARLAEGPRRLEQESEELEGHRARLAEAHRRAMEAQRTAERKNAELESVDRKMKDLTIKLNSARSNKEYDALKHEIATLKADFEILEEEALKQWEVSDVREEEAKKEEGKIEALEAELEETRREWEESARGVRDHLSGLEEKRAKRAADVPDAWLRTYERVLELRGVPSVVPILDQYCQGCQMSVTIHDVTRAIRALEVVQCHACSRLLYAETL